MQNFARQHDGYALCFFLLKNFLSLLKTYFNISNYSTKKENNYLYYAIPPTVIIFILICFALCVIL